MKPTFDVLEKALLAGATLHAFLSGGGLRVVRLTREGKLVGYGEHPDVYEALRHAGEDYLAGGRPYGEVYGEKGLYPAYITGSNMSVTDLDRWVLRGRTFDASAVDGEFVFEMKGTGFTETPEWVLERVRTRKSPVEWHKREFTYQSVACEGPNGSGGVTTTVVACPPGKTSDQAWSFDIRKKASTKTLYYACYAALLMPEEALD